MAEAMGLSPNTMTTYERGRREIPRLVALAAWAVHHRVGPAKELADPVSAASRR